MLLGQTDAALIERMGCITNRLTFIVFVPVHPALSTETVYVCGNKLSVGVVVLTDGVAAVDGVLLGITLLGLGVA
jgi:hypothetical protein